MSDEDQSKSSGGWQFRQNDATPADAGQAEPSDSYALEPPDDTTQHTRRTAEQAASVNWTASEYIAHEKNPVWYLALAIAAGAVAGVDYVLTSGDLVSAVMIVVLAIFFGVYAGRKPRTLDYKLDGSGLSIGGKLHRYDEFRSFAIMPEGAFTNITFMPLKRFSPSLTVYYSPKDEENIVDILGEHLPMEKREHDIVDRFLQYIRF